MSRLAVLAVGAAWVVLLAAQGQNRDERVPQRSVGLVPINDLAAGDYIGFPGGLYPGGSNSMPPAHLAAGVAAAKTIQLLDGNGNPDAQRGKIVPLSIGMSNTSQEFCNDTAPLTVCPCTCRPYSFIGQAAADRSVETSRLVIVNGAMSGQVAIDWAAPANRDYDFVRDNRLRPAGVTERQVQAVWLKVADISPNVSLPSMDADAYVLEGRIGQDVRALKVRYPNLRLVYLSSRMARPEPPYNTPHKMLLTGDGREHSHSRALGEQEGRYAEGPCACTDRVSSGWMGGAPRPGRTGAGGAGAGDDGAPGG
ncbi:MAG: hypothetical protein A3G76_04670 [Acidobacteria bacterium RIFCSPLOWO2_12_FULL_65_11]|nr:MAG: hypothetical protein A3H95_11250 [Acidobacteria bacterium RIFCSPLOWO2_02_FULL_64_15]OFW28245.1 MAG: hypothetical protein A3G76_04670 [Acidobacteria bacterium RIFCSPLOWO2_12_FULL_65_11]